MYTVCAYSMCLHVHTHMNTHTGFNVICKTYQATVALAKQLQIF